MKVAFRVLDDPALTCAELLVEVAVGGGQLVLTGGSTPRAAYALAASAGADWRGSTVFFSDERCVPPGDERSNYGMARAALLDPLGAYAPTVHRIRGELGPDAAADRYEHLLRAGDGAGLGGDGAQFDLVLLGLGPDTHIASLFPDQPALAERDRLAVGVPEAGHEPYVPRVSLTLPALAAAARVVFLVTGAGKADAVARAFGKGTVADPSVPASMLAEMRDRIDVLLDSEAAAGL